MNLQQKRYITIAGIFAASGFFILLGDAWEIGAVPAPYVGYIVAAIGIAGLFGVNIWAGGPLDKKLDAAQQDKAEE